MLKKAELRHASLRRLLDAAKEIANIEGPAALAAALVESEQTVTNWGRRGVSGKGAMKAQATFGCSANWVLTGSAPRLVQGDPHAPPTAPMAAEPPATYTAVTAAQAIDTLTRALMAMPDPDRETAATLLAGLARNPEGQWPIWLLDLIQRNTTPQTWGVGNNDRTGIPDRKVINDSGKMQGSGRTIVFGPALTEAFSYGSPPDDRADPATPPAKKRGGASDR